MKENQGEIGYNCNDHAFNNEINMNEDNVTPMEFASADQVDVPDFDLTGSDILDEDLCEALGNLVPESLENCNLIANSDVESANLKSHNLQNSKDDVMSEENEKIRDDLHDFKGYEDIKQTFDLEISNKDDDQILQDEEILNLKYLSPCSVVLHNSIKVSEIFKCAQCKPSGNINENLNNKYELNDEIIFDNSSIKEENLIELDEPSQFEKSIMHSKYKCDICHEHFTNKKNFLKHMRTHRPKNQSKENSNKPVNYKCEICHEDLKNKKNLEKHIRTHENGYQCDVCKKPFSTKSAFICHFSRIHVKKLHYCCFCNEGFEEEEDLLIHLPIHFEGV